jgi:dTDP-4-amino-4,6-dideoxygalactose transaminase
LYYPTPTHRLAPFRGAGDLPETERAAAQCLSLPVHPSLSGDDLERIVTAVSRLAGAGGEE